MFGQHRQPGRGPSAYFASSSLAPERAATSVNQGATLSIHHRAGNKRVIHDEQVTFRQVLRPTKLSIRFGNLPDSNLVTRYIRPNSRVLVASKRYLESHGLPQHPDELHQHRCLVMEQRGTLMNEWRFERQDAPATVRVTPAMVCDDGALLRQWVLAGAGIASKSWWDVKRDVEQGRLTVLFPEQFIGFSRHDRRQVGLQFVYPQRRFQPLQVTAFSEFFIQWLENE
ncbi:hypothetical protein GV764_10955 [Atlantibacter hermannii]|nr:hypothetical protein [Atlantibacter hermannii]